MNFLSAELGPVLVQRPMRLLDHIDQGEGLADLVTVYLEGLGVAHGLFDAAHDVGIVETVLARSVDDHLHAAGPAELVIDEIQGLANRIPLREPLHVVMGEVGQPKARDREQRHERPARDHTTRVGGHRIAEPRQQRASGPDPHIAAAALALEGGYRKQGPVPGPLPLAPSI